MILPSILLGLLPLVQDPESLLGEKKVQVKEGWYYKGPTRTSDPLEKAEHGEDVNVTAVEGRFSKVVARKGKINAFITSVSLTPKEKFSVSAADQKEGEKLAAQGLEGQRGLNPETEKEYRSQGGAARDKSYNDLDALMARPSVKGDRPALEKALREFRQAGKLGEFSPVK
ncbi:MAG TPA: hypothetical protein VF950_30495 [Planctomycetota bacterium]